MSQASEIIKRFVSRLGDFIIHKYPKMASTARVCCLKWSRLLLDNRLVANGRKFSHVRWPAQKLSLQHISRFMSVGVPEQTQGKLEHSEKLHEAGVDERPATESELEKKLTLEIESLNKEINSLKEKEQILEDKYKRSLADSENMRLRLTKQIEDAKLFGIQGFCKDLLEVADILSRATESVPKEEVSDRNPHLKSLYEGLTMTEAQLHQVFKRHGLCIVNPLNEKFDPNYHEALFQQEVQGKEPGTVVVVSKVGYKLRERVIRPALVGVAKG